MIQRDNGSPGITKEVTYLIQVKNSHSIVNELVELNNALMSDGYLLKELHTKRGSNFREYLVTFKSFKEGLK